MTRLFVLLGLAFVLGAAGFAAAGPPRTKQYGNPMTTEQPPPTSGTAATTGRGSGGLPFTGVDLAVIAVGGITVVLCGGVLRRVGRRSD